VSLSSSGSLWGTGPSADDLLDLVRANGGLDDPVMRQRAAALYIESEILRLGRLRTLSARLQGKTPGAEASIQKIMGDEHGQHVMEIAKRLAGTDGMIAGSGPAGGSRRLAVGATEVNFPRGAAQYPDVDPIWHYGFLFSPRSPSAAARSRCSATSSPSRCSVHRGMRRRRGHGERRRCRRTRRSALGGSQGVAGVVLVLTFGTGIGSGLFVDGTLVPNTELGHLELDGRNAESHAAARVREREGIGWKQWAPRVERYLGHLELLFSPDLFVVGGGASKAADVASR
jgi:hypothetical protein